MLRVGEGEQQRQHGVVAVDGAGVDGQPLLHGVHGGQGREALQREPLG